MKCKAERIADCEYEITFQDEEPYKLSLPPGLSDLDQKRAVSEHITRRSGEMLQRRIARLQRSLDVMDGWSDLKKQSAQEKQPPRPPRFAQTLFALLAQRGTAKNELGDMEQMYRDNVEQLGEPTARRLYWFEVLHSIRPAITRVLFEVILDYFRRKIG